MIELKFRITLVLTYHLMTGWLQSGTELQLTFYRNDNSDWSLRDSERAIGVVEREEYVW